MRLKYNLLIHKVQLSAWPLLRGDIDRDGLEMEHIILGVLR